MPDRVSGNRGRPMYRPPAATPYDRSSRGDRPAPRPAFDNPRVRVPPGYRGNAIVDGEERPLGVPAAPPPPADRPPLTEGERTDGDYRYPEEGLPGDAPPEPRFDGLPRVSELGARGYDSRRDLSPDTPDDTLPDMDIADGFSPGADDPSTPASIVPTGGLFDARHFPFGHGFGFDEILLLGLILLLLHENHGGDRGDLDETVVLLGILLLCG